MGSAIETIAGYVYGLRDHFAAASENKGADFDREAGFAIQIMASNDYSARLAMADWSSVQAAVVNVAAIGISLNPAKKQAYLVPRKGKICLDIGYMGLIDLAVDAGSIFWAQAHIVRKNDVFKLNGFDKPPLHEYEPFAETDARGPVVGAYVIVKTHDGDYLTHPMAIAKIHEIRNRSEAWKKYLTDKSKICPWATDEEEMIKKTVVKQAYKYWPKTERSSRLDRAIHLLNTDGGEGISQTNSAPAGECVDLAPVIAGVAECLTDAQALAYWKTNNPKFAKQPPDHAALKAAVAARRKQLAAELEARTVEMPPADVAPQEPQGAPA